MTEDSVHSLCNEAEKLLATENDLIFIDKLQDYISALNDLLAETPKKSAELARLQQHHNKILSRAEDISSREKSITQDFKKHVKGLRAYMNRFPSRMSGFTKRKF